MKKKFYLTTSIAYVNAPPHLGHALELIQADTIVRYRRLIGDSVFFATGTDEHGVKIVRRAEELQKSPQELVDENAEKFRALRTVLGLSWDSFIRTTDKKRHWPAVINAWKALYRQGDLYRRVYEGMYCVGHEAFVTKKDLTTDGFCELHKTKPEILREENWFFRLSKYKQKIKKLLEKKIIHIIPETRGREILSLITEGVEDVSFSRPRKDLRWGIPVPGDDTQTIYVWADALVNYLSHVSGDAKKWWPPGVQIIGKDILRFHALIWLGMLLALKKKLPKKIFVHGFITVDGEKMSKSLGNVADPVELAALHGTDALRYYLLSEIPATEDGDFSIEKFNTRYQGDCANGLGNLVARSAAVGSRVSPLPYLSLSVAQAVRRAGAKIEKEYHADMEKLQLHSAIRRAWEMIGFADRYINENQPWTITDENKLRALMTDISWCILLIQRLIAPFLPETAEKIGKQFMLKNKKLTIKKGAALFPRLLL